MPVPVKVLLYSSYKLSGSLRQWLAVLRPGWRRRSVQDCVDKQPPELDTKSWKKIYLACAVGESRGFLRDLSHLAERRSTVPVLVHRELLTCCHRTSSRSTWSSRGSVTV